MGVTDDILKAVIKPGAARLPASSSAADAALRESGQAQGRFLDREPSISDAELPRNRRDQIVHVDNLSSIAIPTETVNAAASLTLVPVGARDLATGVARPIPIDSSTGTDAVAVVVENSSPVPVQGSVTITGPVTVQQTSPLLLLSSVQPIVGSTFPISAVSLPLPTGAAQQVVSATANAPAQQTVGIASGSILAANASRKECVVVNTGTTIIYLGLGQTPTTVAYHVALSPCGTANDGTGGVYVSDMWTGAINAIGSAAAGTVVVTELT